MATAPLSLVTPSAKQASAQPTRKAIAAGVAGALATIAVFVLNTYVLPHDKPLTAEISVAITTVLSFAISYFVPPSTTDQVTAS
jgi:fluoride ion exporter CrcB/FEX